METNIKLTIGVALQLSNIVPSLIVTNVTYKLIDQLMDKLQVVVPAQQEQTKKVFESLGLNASENVDLNHPLHKEVTDAIVAGELDLSKRDVQIFRSAQLSACLKGLRLNYAERKFLEYWLVKP